MDSFFHPIHVPTFKANTKTLRFQIERHAWKEIDLFFVATYAAVCALGTESMREVSPFFTIIEQSMLPTQAMRLYDVG